VRSLRSLSRTERVTVVAGTFCSGSSLLFRQRFSFLNKRAARQLTKALSFPPALFFEPLFLSRKKKWFHPQKERGLAFFFLFRERFSFFPKERERFKRKGLEYRIYARKLYIH